MQPQHDDPVAAPPVALLPAANHHHPQPALAGEKTVAGVPWRYGDPSAVLDWGADLGVGSRSRVRAATRRAPPTALGAPAGRPLAVKILAKDHARFSALDVRGEVEAHAAAAACPAAVALHEVWEDGDAVYLVQDACTGGELYDRVRAQGRLPEPDAAAAVRAVLVLLAHMHASGWAHRDVKLENFLYAGVREEGVGVSGDGAAAPPTPSSAVRGPLLGVDFGSAARLAPGESLAGPPAGSVPYLAPEVVAGRPAGRPADLWSAGCILFAALVGQLPFGGDTDDDVLAAIAGGVGGVPRGTAWARVSEPARALVAALLARDPGARPTAADALNHPWLLAGGECGADGGPPPPLSRDEARGRARDAAREAAAAAKGRLASAAARARERVRDAMAARAAAKAARLERRSSGGGGGRG
jgi:serine/threonine protein kinase